MDDRPGEKLYRQRQVKKIGYETSDFEENCIDDNSVLILILSRTIVIRENPIYWIASGTCVCGVGVSRVSINNILFFCFYIETCSINYLFYLLKNTLAQPSSKI